LMRKKTQMMLSEISVESHSMGAGLELSILMLLEEDQVDLGGGTAGADPRAGMMMAGSSQMEGTGRVTPGSLSAA